MPLGLETAASIIIPVSKIIRSGDLVLLIVFVWFHLIGYPTFWKMYFCRP